MRSLWSLCASLAALIAVAFTMIFTACSSGNTCLRQSDCEDGMACIVGVCTAVAVAEGGVDAGSEASADANVTTTDGSFSDADADIDGDTDADETDTTSEDDDDAGDAAGVDGGA